ncbi:MAG: ECF-type sigma factor [Planctomycetota bacterium]
MATDNEKTVSQVLKAAAAGDRSAARDLLPMVYKELRALARAKLKHLPPGQTLQPTALVHEAYMHVVGNEDPGWKSKGHFFGAAAQAMRNILVDQARRKAAQKRGGEKVRVSMEAAEPLFEAPSADVLAVDEAIKRLEEEDPRKGQIVNLRYFARMSTSETAAALGVSVATIVREWRYIRAWLVRELKREPSL